jgi:hypothetical protein
MSTPPPHIGKGSDPMPALPDPRQARINLLRSENRQLEDLVVRLSEILVRRILAKTPAT